MKNRKSKQEMVTFSYDTTLDWSTSCSTFWELSSSFCLNFEVLILRGFWCLKSDPFWFFWFFAPWKVILWFFVLLLFDFVQWFDFNTLKTWSLILIFTTVDFLGSCKRLLSMRLTHKNNALNFTLSWWLNATEKAKIHVLEQLQERQHF